MSVQQTIQGPLPAAEEGRTVLIVDDEPSMRTALSETVRRLGYHVRGAIDGADAIEQVERLKPWLVVTDLKMPRVTGLELVKAIKQKAPQTFHHSDDGVRHGGDRGGSHEVRRERLYSQTVLHGLWWSA
jgi:PleD family two-component response regulator